MRGQIGNRFGFTLVELLLATMIGALVVIVALATYRSVARSRAEAQYFSELTAHGRYGLNRIRDDLANFFRCRDLEEMRLVGISGGTTEKPRDRLSMYVVSEKRLSKGEAESDIYEVEYGLGFSEKKESYFLTRRRAAVREPAEGNKAGTLTPIATYVRTLRFEYFDGTNWQRQWSAYRGIPLMVRVSMELADEKKEQYRVISISQEISLAPLPTIRTGKDDLEGEIAIRETGLPE